MKVLARMEVMRCLWPVFSASWRTCETTKNNLNEHGYSRDHESEYFFFFSSRRRHTRFDCDWSSDVCSSDLITEKGDPKFVGAAFYARNFDDLKKLTRLPGASGIETMDEPGGGKRVRLKEPNRSEERRVGKECRSRWSPYH